MPQTSRKQFDKNIYNIYKARKKATKDDQETLARVSTSTSLAPAASNTLEHSRTVAPVVKTSSMTRILFSATASGFLTSKAPRTFVCLSGPESWV